MKRLAFGQCFGLLILPVLMLDSLAADAPDLTRHRSIVPETIAGIETLSAADVINRAQQADNLLVIDSRIESDRLNGYIENSISLPDTKTNCESLAAISRDMHRPLLFYCNGIECGRSVVAIKIARSCGYTNLLWFRGGFEEWLENDYPYVR